VTREYPFESLVVGRARSDSWPNTTAMRTANTPGPSPDGGRTAPPAVLGARGS